MATYCRTVNEVHVKPAKNRPLRMTARTKGKVLGKYMVPVELGRSHVNRRAGTSDTSMPPSGE